MQIAVVGCGWLGLPLALELQQMGHRIVATCRTEQKAKDLRELGFSCEPYQLGESLGQHRFNNLFESSVLVLNIPVGRKSLHSEDFVKHIESLLALASSSRIQYIVFISTTSVYGEVEGIVTEKIATNAQTGSGQINLAIERLVKQYFTKHCTIIRPAGLVGSDRHPVYFLTGKKQLADPQKLVNLVHQKDVINAIVQIIEKKLWGHTLHLSAAEHPSRQEYYQWAACKLNLLAPEFVTRSSDQIGKTIDPSYSLGILDTTLFYPSPFDMLE